MRSALERLDELGLKRPPRLKPSMLLFDLENTPNLAWVYDYHKPYNVVSTERDWWLLCFSWKWWGETTTHFEAIWHDPKFDPYPGASSDLWVAERLHALFSAAHIITAHNGDAFDERKGNARFVYHDLGPAAPRQTIDTLKEYRRFFADPSAKLDEIARRHDLMRKMPTTGWAMWYAAMSGDVKAQRMMERYTRADVRALEAVYLKIRAFIGQPGKRQHPNFGHWNLQAKKDGRPVCPKCGHERVQFRGHEEMHRTSFTEWATIWCVPEEGDCCNGGTHYGGPCGGYSRVRKSEPQHLLGGVGAV